MWCFRSLQFKDHIWTINRIYETTAPRQSKSQLGESHFESSTRQQTWRSDWLAVIQERLAICPNVHELPCFVAQKGDLCEIIVFE
jgi:hypothetical protein